MCFITLSVQEIFPSSTRIANAVVVNAFELDAIPKFVFSFTFFLLFIDCIP